MCVKTLEYSIAKPICSQQKSPKIIFQPRFKIQASSRDVVNSACATIAKIDFVCAKSLQRLVFLTGWATVYRFAAFLKVARSYFSNYFNYKQIDKSIRSKWWTDKWIVWYNKWLPYNRKLSYVYKCIKNHWLFFMYRWYVIVTK